jgi:hypothetical protein
LSSPPGPVCISLTPSPPFSLSLNFAQAQWVFWVRGLLSSCGALEIQKKADEFAVAQTLEQLHLLLFLSIPLSLPFSLSLARITTKHTYRFPSSCSTSATSLSVTSSTSCW